MKNFLLIALLSLITTLGYSQDSTQVDNSNISDTERIIDKYSGQAYEAVKGIAQSLKVPAEHVYTVLVKQAVVNSISLSLFGVFATIFLIWGLTWFLNEDNWGKPDYDGDRSPTAKSLIGATLGMVSVFLFIGFFVNIETIVGGFVNPEYYAIKEILSTFS